MKIVKTFEAFLLECGKGNKEDKKGKDCCEKCPKCEKEDCKCEEEKEEK